MSSSYGLKKFLQPHTDPEMGKLLIEDCRDCILINIERFRLPEWCRLHQASSADMAKSTVQVF
ncbi:MAG: hypothetical protein ABI575_02775 [Oxalobacteraceae bacterium]